MRTLLEAGKLENLKEAVIINKVDVMGISEVRWEGSGELMNDGFIIFHSGGDAKGSHDVGVVLGPRVRDTVISVRYVDNGVIVVRLQGKKVYLVIVQIYMPHSGLAEKKWKKHMEKRWLRSRRREYVLS